MRVKFEGEEGSGPGVNRGFFSSLSNELKSSDTSKSVLKQVRPVLDRFFNLNLSLSLSL